MLKNYILVSIRNLLRNKTISFINIFGLSVSMSVCLLLILIVADQFTYDNFHKKKDRIYRIITERTQLKEYVWSTATTAYPLINVVNSHESVEKATIIKKGFSGIADWKDAEIPFEGLYTDNNFFYLFDFHLEKGNPEIALSLPNSMVITMDLAKKLFGDADPINQTIEVEELGEFMVTGVIGELPGKTHIHFEALASVNYLPILEKEDKLLTTLDSWENIYDNYIYFLIKEAGKAEDLKPLLQKTSEINYAGDNEYEYKFLLQQLNEITPGPLLSNNIGFPGLPLIFIYILIGLSLVVLLSACFNYANLTTARSVNRAKEMGVRKVVGAKRHHIMGQFMVEAIMISIAAFVFADLMLQFLHPSLNNFLASFSAPLRFDLTPGLYFIFAGFVILTGILAGLFPALFFAAIEPLSALRKSLNFGPLSRKLRFSRLNIRKVLVVVQFAFTIFFIITIITIYQQMHMVMTADHGFKTEGIINIKLQGMDPEIIKDEFKQLTEVHGVSLATHMPALGNNYTAFAKLGGVDEDSFGLSFIGVDNNYIRLMEIKLIAGRNFPETMPDKERFILINEKAVNRFGWSSPIEAIGKVVSVDDQQMEIIGVIQDFHYERLDEEIGPMGLRFLPGEAENLLVVTGGKRSKETITRMEEIWKKHTNRPFEFSFYEDDMRISYGHFEAILMVLGYITVITVSIACLGLLGMVMFHVQNKTKEIGIRKVLGAKAADILMTIGKSFLAMIAISYLIGGPLAYFVNNLWLQSYAYRMDFGFATLLVGFVLVLVIVIFTIGFQLYRALRINPAVSLRDE